MPRHCRSPGCTAEATRYGTYCTSHKSTLRRHGDAGQRGITKADLKVPLRAIRGRIERNSGNPVWGQSEDRWREMVGHARVMLARQGAGSTYVRQAASETVKLAEAVEAGTVMETAFAVYLMADLIAQLERHAAHLAPEATSSDILIELSLKDGLPLTVSVESLMLADKEVFSIADGTLLICLDRQITQGVIDAMADLEPSRIICLDAGFQGSDQLKANAVQTFKSRARDRETAIEFRTV